MIVDSDHTAEVDVAEVENAAPYAMTAFGWWRSDLPAEINNSYWRDVHGPLAARIPGFYQYRQLHLDRPVIGLLGSNEVTAEPVEGIAQELFLTSEDIQTFVSHPFVTTYIFNDEQNLARRNATLSSLPGAARTFRDVTDEATPQGPPPHPSYVVLLQRTDGADRADFHHQVERLARGWGDQEGVLRLRYTPLEAYDENGWRSPGVDHHWDERQQYQAWIEIVVDDLARLSTLPVINREVTRTVTVQPVRAIHTIVFQGRPTEVGLRGWPAVQTIRAAAASNQQDPELLRALYGDIVDGVKN
jgi:hypothetical protein